MFDLVVWNKDPSGVVIVSSDLYTDLIQVNYIDKSGIVTDKATGKLIDVPYLTLRKKGNTRSDPDGFVPVKNAAFEIRAQV